MSIRPDQLRALADFFDDHPTLAEHCWMQSVNIIPLTKAEWHECVRDLGPCEKRATDNQLWATRKVDDGINVKVIIGKEDTCERVQVGVKTVEREVYPADVTPTVELVEQPVYEWQCPPSWVQS